MRTRRDRPEKRTFVRNSISEGERERKNDSGTFFQQSDMARTVPKGRGSDSVACLPRGIGVEAVYMAARNSLVLTVLCKK